MSLLDKVSQVSQEHATGRKLVHVGDKKLTKKASVLDLIDDNETTLNRVADNKIKTRVKTRVVIMDNDRVLSIMSMSRAQRREEIQKMSDAERRKFLTIYKRIKDEQENPKRWNVAGIVIDSALSGTITWEEAKSAIEFIKLNNDEIDKFIDEGVAGDIDESHIERLAQIFADKGVTLTYENIQEPELTEDFQEAELDDELLNLIEGEGAELADSLGTLTELSQLESIVDSVIAKYLNRGYNYFDVRDTLSKGFSNKINDKKQQAIMDNVVDEIAEAIEEPTENVSVLEAFTKAVEEFVSGDPTALKELAETQIPQETSEESEVEETDEETGDEDFENEEFEDFEDEDFEDISLEDSTKLANCILSGKLTHKVYDKVAAKVPVLRKVLLRASDCYLAETPTVESSVIQVPMSCEEFQSVWSTPRYLPEVAKTGIQCPAIENYIIKNGCIVTNPDTIPQTWIPTTGSIQSEEFVDNEALRNYIQDRCVLVEDVLRYASKTNQLAVIDSKFYKTRLTDECWHYDSKPDCLTAGAPESGTVYPCWVEIPVEVPCFKELIYGQQYSILLP